MASLVKLTIYSLALLSGFVACMPEDGQPIAKREVATCPKSVARDGCLTGAMAEEITDRWAEIFNLRVGGKDLKELVECTTSPDIYTYDKTYEFGKTGKGVQYTSNKELYQIQQGAYEGRAKDPLQKGLFHTVFHIHNCNVITWRLMLNGTTSGIASPPDSTNTVKGKPFDFYGVDILFIEKGSQRIKHVVTSADWTQLWWAYGMSFNGTPLCPGTKSSDM